MSEDKYEVQISFRRMLVPDGEWEEDKEFHFVSIAREDEADDLHRLFAHFCDKLVDGDRRGVGVDEEH